MNAASILSTFEFGVVFGLLALSFYSALSTGLLSMASITLAVCGAFLFVHASDQFGWPPVIALLGATVIGGLGAVILSILLLHLESHYIAMATIAIVLVTQVAVLNLPAITGGVDGLTILTQLPPLYIVGALVVSIWVFARLRRSKYGLAAELAREDTTVASTLGINIRALRTVGFVISGCVGGLAGAVLASLYGYINSDTFSSDLAFTCLAAVVLGGAFHWAGPLVGGIIFTMLPELLSGFGPAADVINGVILIVIMIFLPRGLVDPLRWNRLSKRFRRDALPAAAGVKQPNELRDSGATQR